MTASLVSLFQSRSGWSNEERAQFVRIERLLEDAGFAVDVEHGLSDEGEPWCVFCSRVTGDVIIHAACIDGRFMFDSSTLPRPIEGASFQKCAERFFQDVALPVPLIDRQRDVLLHPSALLASLFITVLLYAQATTEQPLFADEAVDVDAEDEATAELSPLALRLRAIAQQVAEYVASNDSTAPQQQAYTNPALAAIPAGMALAVIAIAQDLAVAQALFGEDLERQSLPATTEIEVAARIEPDPPVEQADPAAIVDATEALPADGAQETQAQAPQERGSELAAMVAAFAANGFYIAEIHEQAAAAVDELGDALPLDGLLAALLGDQADTAITGAGDDNHDDSLTVANAGAELLSDLFDVVSLAAVERFVVDLADRVVEFEVVRVADGFIERLELALMAGDPAGDSLDLIVGDGETAIDLAANDTGGAPVDGAPASGSPASGGVGDAVSGVTMPPAVAPEAGKPVAGYNPQAGGGETGTDTGAQAGADPQPVQGSVFAIYYPEAAAQIEAFAGAVGDLQMRVEEDGDAVFWDASVTIHVESRDIVFESVFLADNTKLLFVGVAWDFDGFDGLV